MTMKVYTEFPGYDVLEAGASGIRIINQTAPSLPRSTPAGDVIVVGEFNRSPGANDYNKPLRFSQDNADLWGGIDTTIKDIPGGPLWDGKTDWNGNTMAWLNKLAFNNLYFVRVDTSVCKDLSIDRGNDHGDTLGSAFTLPAGTVVAGVAEEDEEDEEQMFATMDDVVFAAGATKVEGVRLRPIFAISETRLAANEITRVKTVTASGKVYPVTTKRPYGDTGYPLPHTGKIITSDSNGIELVLLLDPNTVSVGNYKFQMVDPGAVSQSLEVSVVTTDGVTTITVSLATNSSSAITSTIADVVAALNTHATAKTIIKAYGAGSTPVSVFNDGQATPGPVSFSLYAPTVTMAHSAIVLEGDTASGVTPAVKATWHQHCDLRYLQAIGTPDAPSGAYTTSGNVATADFILSARTSQNIMAALKEHVVGFSKRGRGRRAVVRPPLQTVDAETGTWTNVSWDTVLGSSASGVGAFSSSRVIYAYPYIERRVIDIDTDNDQVLGFDACLACVAASIPPESSPAQITELLKTLLNRAADTFDAPGNRRVLGPDGYDTLADANICPPVYDGDYGWLVAEGKNTDGSQISKVRMSDYIVYELKKLATPYKSKNPTKKNINRFLSDMKTFLGGLKSENNPDFQRIADFGVNVEYGNTPDVAKRHIRLIWVEVSLLAPMDNPTLMVNIDEALEITLAA